MKRESLRQVDVPGGKSGDWEVARFESAAEDIALFNLREGWSSRRFMKPGTYTHLTHHGQIIISDTPAELSDLKVLTRHVSEGHVLVNGLGLGIVVQAILDLPAVEHLTVVEKSTDVISLVAQHWLDRYGDRLNIVCADAFDWKPPKGQRYQTVWHDIWDAICADNLEGIHKLHRKYGRRCDWQGSWCRYECERALKNEKSSFLRFG